MKIKDQAPADRKVAAARDEHEMERLAYLETLDPRQRQGEWSLDPDH